MRVHIGASPRPSPDSPSPCRGARRSPHRPLLRSRVTKRVKEKAARRSDPRSADSMPDAPAEAVAPGAAGGCRARRTGGGQLLAGLKGPAEREGAAKEDTPTAVQEA